ncbi:hypothetical protein [Ferroacidibacillus organovorans]|uniref:Uncharacterized protein n=1 Tax=Ferroacidibacillus organovorans TaxID=1765683 RepID=A0A1V4EV92_9BACL|nr:hypothetical protein [Ferroacidibacillus organovorans]OPG16684.1 hypothetical protein B2M26_05350 [Ferroacidibacillus organovorans]
MDHPLTEDSQLKIEKNELFFLYELTQETLTTMTKTVFSLGDLPSSVRIGRMEKPFLLAFETLRAELFSEKQDEPYDWNAILIQLQLKFWKAYRHSRYLKLTPYRNEYDFHHLPDEAQLTFSDADDVIEIYLPSELHAIHPPFSLRYPLTIYDLTNRFYSKLIEAVILKNTAFANEKRAYYKRMLNGKRNHRITYIVSPHLEKDIDTHHHRPITNALKNNGLILIDQAKHTQLIIEKRDRYQDREMKAKSIFIRIEPI